MVTYHPALNGLSQIIRKHFHVLEVNEKAKSVFSVLPIVSFRNCKTLGRTLVRAKMPQVNHRKGSFKCNKPRCLVCTKMVEFVENNLWGNAQLNGGCVGIIIRIIAANL